MKRIISVILSCFGCVLPVLAGGVSNVGKASRAIYILTRDPDATLTVFGFLVDMLLACIPIALISGITTLILKKVFDLDEERVPICFLIIGGFLLLVWLLLYFFA